MLSSNTAMQACRNRRIPIHRATAGMKGLKKITDNAGMAALAPMMVSLAPQDLSTSVVSGIATPNVTPTTLIAPITAAAVNYSTST